MIIPTKEQPAICWWSGGVTSAVACKVAIDLWGSENCRCIFIDTKNEDEDTYRFMRDFGKWCGITVETITNESYNNIEEVWRKFKGLNFAHGAICSSELKRAVRLKFQKENKYTYQVFGFDMDETRRAAALLANYPDSSPIFPLLMLGIRKKECIEIMTNEGVEVPRAYQWGFLNNNCLQTGCVQGGIGYWQRIRDGKPELFEKMANMEHELTAAKGKPVTMLKDQAKGGGKVFLKPHPMYPEIKDLSMMKGRTPEPLMECNGFCGTNDLSEKPPSAQTEINFDE